MRGAWPALLLLLLLLPAPLLAGPVDYLRDIKPVLKERCFACHGALKQEADLRLDTAKAVREVLEVGKPDDSLLMERLEAEEGQRMPPEGAPLTPAQLAAFRTWIREGAPAPANEQPEADPRSHWAFGKPKRPALPGASTAHPIDRLLAAQRDPRLTPAPPADKAILLQRLSLDLIGLPPTREELRAFLADSSPDAYERIVERLLASPQYGERWGRHWMDVWRYSDWYGRRSVPDVLNSYGMIWRWRDWIVRSVNEDKPYDRMIIEMLAADEADPLDSDNIVATGFLVRNFFRWNYNNWMRDNVEHTAKAFLGLTFNCCQCHDHKYDPISQEEYFQLRAIFEPLEIRHDRVPGEPDPGPYPKYSYGAAYKPITSGLVCVVDEKPDAETYLYARGDERNRVANKPPIPPGVPASVGGPKSFQVQPITLPPQRYYPGTHPAVREDESRRRADALAAAEKSLAAVLPKVRPALTAVADRRTLSTDAERTKAVQAVEDVLAERDWRMAEVHAARSEQAALQARIAADDVKYLNVSGDLAALSATAARAEKQAAADAASARQRKAAFDLLLAQRTAATGDEKAKAALTTATKQHADALAAVAAATKALAAPGTAYTPLSPLYPAKSSGRRLALARWIAHRDNPLTARVAVNHIWMRHFGQPLVATPQDFGRNGQAPTHPALLDWLACELMDNGWQMKPLHRLIVTSEAYRMRSNHPQAAQQRAIDPDNRLLWAYPTNRLEAEAIRDRLLAAAGQLDTTMGGPELPQDQGLTSHRRSLYFSHHGEQRMAFLDLFDAANPCDCYRRSSSVMPQQALALGNSELPLAMARTLADRLTSSVSQSGDPEFVSAAFEQVLSRPPTPAERSASLAFLNRQAASGKGRVNLIHALMNHSDFVTVR